MNRPDRQSYPLSSHKIDCPQHDWLSKRKKRSPRLPLRLMRYFARACYQSLILLGSKLTKGTYTLILNWPWCCSERCWKLVRVCVTWVLWDWPWLLPQALCRYRLQNRHRSRWQVWWIDHLTSTQMRLHERGRWGLTVWIWVAAYWAKSWASCFRSFCPFTEQFSQLLTYRSQVTMPEVFEMPRHHFWSSLTVFVLPWVQT